jgi:hypothetical protein
MIKNEQFRGNDPFKRIVSTGLTTPLPLRPSMFQTTSTDIPQRSIDPHAIDISSIKGRFAWEKIALGDTYIPVIFRYVNIIFLYQRLSKEYNPEKYSDESLKLFIELYNMKNG